MLQALHLQSTALPSTREVPQLQNNYRPTEALKDGNSVMFNVTLTTHSRDHEQKLPDRIWKYPSKTKRNIEWTILSL